MDYIKKDTHYMSIALHLAHEALNAQEVPVGCIFIYHDNIIANGRNTVNETKNATRHAEFNCVDQIYTFSLKNKLDIEAVFTEIDVYVTVEPCIMCAALLFQLKIRSIVYGCKNDRFGGETVLRVYDIMETSCRIQGGVCGDQALQLLKDFYNNVNPNAPKPKIKGKKGRKNKND